MKTTTVKTAKLLEKLEDNRDKHLKDFKEANKKWRKAVEERLEAVLVEVQAGDYENVQSPTRNLPKPENYIASYDTAIARLQWEIEAEVTLDESEFANYVLDKWDWAGRFMANTSSYLSA